MTRVYDDTDLVWSKRGDLVLSHVGDIADTEQDPLRSIVQEMYRRVKCSLGEWETAPRIAASLADFVGRSNSKRNAEAIKTRIRSALVRDGLVDSKDLEIKYFPISQDKLLFRITLNVAPTSENRGSRSIKVAAVYSYSENNPYMSI